MSTTQNISTSSSGNTSANSIKAVPRSRRSLVPSLDMPPPFRARPEAGREHHLFRRSGLVERVHATGVRSDDGGLEPERVSDHHGGGDRGDERRQQAILDEILR